MAKYFDGYIWNFSPLRLTQRPNFIEGWLQFGDLYDEAWLLVKFLLEFSSKNQNVTCRLIDSDGEFLLIEAADFVPQWLGPSNDEGRIWLAKGQLFLIPQSVKKTIPIYVSRNRVLIFRFSNCFLRSLFYKQKSLIFFCRVR